MHKCKYTFTKIPSEPFIHTHTHTHTHTHRYTHTYIIHAHGTLCKRTYEHGNGSKWLTFTLACMEDVFGICNLQTHFIVLIQYYLRHSLLGGSQTSTTLPSFPLILSFCPGVGPPPIPFTGTFRNHKAFIYIWTQYHFLFEGGSLKLGGADRWNRNEMTGKA